MEIKITIKQTLTILLVLSWIIFIGLCIEAGGFIANAIFAIARPSAVPYLWRQIDLSALFKYDQGHFFVVTLLLGIVAILKAWLFFLIIKILHRKDLDMSQPFNKQVRRFIFHLSYVALMIAIFSGYGVSYTEGLVKQGVPMPDTQHLQIGGADVWLFMAIVLFIIAQMFKRGIEIQSENELTI
ncbi:DUF2975 domain-containing protein [Chitinophaga nivalis]|uniref:DUF2975 domain-containing protein n=1 Tax=Chitinophaga nivalis TaxID=2991709 RepID=A0ABT3IK94_9BACT|nr:DUF2975 domain-containing protein [Chitinophaga nivalis]MCW3465968.1 DUF2975 domain-containing protein [Chitinophaga nivalis]MCW3484341.1 DUF2975 domain-containing protein [Chitinophaga nivalis]